MNGLSTLIFNAKESFSNYRFAPNADTTSLYDLADSLRGMDGPVAVVRLIAAARRHPEILNEQQLVQVLFEMVPPAQGDPC
jgi:hypothetical protein